MSTTIFARLFYFLAPPGNESDQRVVIYKRALHAMGNGLHRVPNWEDMCSCSNGGFFFFISYFLCRTEYQLYNFHERYDTLVNTSLVHIPCIAYIIFCHLPYLKCEFAKTSHWFSSSIEDFQKEQIHVSQGWRLSPRLSPVSDNTATLANKSLQPQHMCRSTLPATRLAQTTSVVSAAVFPPLPWIQLDWTGFNEIAVTRSINTGNERRFCSSRRGSDY